MQRPLRILVYLHSFEPGGVERVALRLCYAWQAAGEDVTVLLGRTEGATRREAPSLDYVLYPSAVSTARFETAWMILCLWRHVRAAPPDVIFCPGNSYTIVAAALRVLLGRRCPPVMAKVSNSLVRQDMLAPVRFFYRLWLRLQGRLITRWVSMAPSMRTEIATAMHVPEHKVAVVEDPALDAREARRLARARDAVHRDDDDGRLFLSVGRLVPQKRFDLLLSAFAKGTGPQDRLVILGEGPRRKPLEVLAQELGLEQRVALPGHDHDIAGWLARADFFLLSSDYEGVPAVVIEAMAAGVQVIATESSASMSEVLGHGRFGRLVPCGDRDALARAISSAEVAHSDVKAARAQAQRFQVEYAAPAYLEIMRTAASEAPGPTDKKGSGHAAAPWGMPALPPSMNMGGSGSPHVSD